MFKNKLKNINKKTGGNPPDWELIPDYIPLNIDNDIDKFNVKTLGSAALELSDKLPYYKDYLSDDSLCYPNKQTSNPLFNLLSDDDKIQKYINITKENILRDRNTINELTELDIKNDTELKEFFNNMCFNLLNSIPSSDYLEKQVRYLNSFKPTSLKFINFYTKVGDKVVNIFIRNGFYLNKDKLLERSTSQYYIQILQSINKDDILFIFKFLGYKFSIELIDYVDNIIRLYISKKEYHPDITPIINIICQFYYKLLINIFENSPKLDKDIYVFRGSTVDEGNIYGNKKNNTYTLASFLSTSLSLQTAIKFSSSSSATVSYITRIKVPKGSRCLFIAGISEFIYELEMLLPAYSSFYSTTEILPFVNKYKYRHNQFIQINYNEVTLMNQYFNTPQIADRSFNNKDITDLFNKFQLL